MRHIKEFPFGCITRFTLVDDSTRLAISVSMHEKTANLQFHIVPELAEKMHGAEFANMSGIHENCEYLDGKSCFCDGRLLNDELSEQWRSQGDQVIWSQLGYEMARLYQQCLE